MRAAAGRRSAVLAPLLVDRPRRSPPAGPRSARRRRRPACRASWPPSPASSPAAATRRRTPCPAPTASTRSCRRTGRPGPASTSAMRTPSQTPANQEKVAAGKMTSLYHWLGSWRRVAYWWLTGSSKSTGWSTYAKRYVAKVMDRYKAQRPEATANAKPARTLNDARRRSRTTARGGCARHGGYGGDVVALRDVEGRQRHAHVHRPAGGLERADRARPEARPRSTSMARTCARSTCAAARSTRGRAVPDALVEERDAHAQDRRRRHQGPPDGRDRRLHGDRAVSTPASARRHDLDLDPIVRREGGHARPSPASAARSGSTRDRRCSSPRSR